MSTALDPRWVENVERGLKDFQRATVDYVFRRMYRDDDCTRRFLVADEVGLGKTLVARGVIARTVRYLWEDIDRIDVVYICSNQDIARQNVRRLNVTGDRDFTLATRITYLPVEIQDLRDNKLNFVSFTPGTSFNLRSSMGRKWERVVLYWLLKEAWDLRRTAPLNVLQGRVTDHRAFRESVGWFRRRKRIDRGLKEGFLDELERRSRQEQAEGQPDLRERFESLYDAFGYARDPGRYPPRARRLRREVIGELRWTLAVACVKALEPDLVILDEFQRFKDLLLGDDAASLLVRELFEYTDEVAEARVLLLSATPYKMYTIADEHADDHHYQDFLDTLRFLYDDDDATAEMERLLKDYRRELFRLGRGGLVRLRELKSEIERRLRKVMVRTERLAASTDRSGMLAEVSPAGMELRSPDVTGFLELQQLARHVGYGDTLPFWKSTPYALSFMEGYKLTERFEEAVSDGSLSRAVARLLRSSNGLSLSWSDIRRYREVDPGNARLRALFADVIERGAWRLLWVPPSLPYYQPAAPFADPELGNLTKRLVFSAWRVVPKVVATLLSYEAERGLMHSFEEEPENTSEARKRRRPLLMFTLSDDRLTGMPVLGILYPSAVLAERLDPLLVARRLATGGELPSSDGVLEAATATAADLLAPLVAGAPDEGPEDESWYWAAPILLDLRYREEAGRAWLRRRNLAAKWQGAGGSEEDVGRWGDHVELAQTPLEGGLELGRPPEDLARVVALIGLAGPAVTALRALRRLGGPGVLKDSEARDAAGQIAWAFRHLFNLPEAMALIRGLDPREPYWQRVLEYSLAGNLQATLDEFAHMLRESLGFTGQDVADATLLIRAVSEAIREALTLRTVSLGVDDVRVDGSDAVQIERRRLRAHFAMRFGDESGTEEQAGARASQVRAAFNSPFWPFVLATTSVGQEGLDFHTYCHAVVHWNLPPNPVDLEQREGRVHRYKGHAVRKNVAQRHGVGVLHGPRSSHRAISPNRSGDGAEDPDRHHPHHRPYDPRDLEAGEPSSSDPWTALFAAGETTRVPGQSELVPFWIYPVEDGARIERHVPALPLSRDQAHLAALKRSLAVYRMVFGQPRQEDLLDFLLRVLPEDEVEAVSEELRIDLSPPETKAEGEETGSAAG